MLRKVLLGLLPAAGVALAFGCGSGSTTVTTHKSGTTQVTVKTTETLPPAAPTGRTAGDALRDAGKDLGDAAKAAGKDLKDAAKDVGKDLKDATKDVGKDLKDAGKAAKDATKDAGKAVKDAAADAKAVARENFVKPIREDLKKLEPRIAELKGDAKTKAEAARRDLDAKLTKLEAGSADAWESLKDGVSKAYQDLKTATK